MIVSYAAILIQKDIQIGIISKWKIINKLVILKLIYVIWQNVEIFILKVWNLILKLENKVNGHKIIVMMLFLWKDIVGMDLIEKLINCSFCLILLKLIKLYTLHMLFLIHILI
jgi:hypothetical protein